MAEINYEPGQETRKALFETKEERRQFDQEYGQRILQDYAQLEQEENARKKQSKKQFSVPALKHIAAPEIQLREPELDEKALKEKRKRQQKDLKAGKKLSVHATCYTSPIMDYEAQRRIIEVNQEPLDDTALDELKEKIFHRKMSAGMFDPDYLGEHYAEVREEMDELRLFLDVFKEEGSPEYEEYRTTHPLSNAERAKISNLELIYEAMHNAWKAALAVHCINVTEGDENPFMVGNFAPNRETKQECGLKKELLKQIISQSDEAQTEELFSHILENQQLDTNLQRSNYMKKNPELNDLFGEVNFFSEKTYDKIASLQKKIHAPENAANYKANREAIDKILADLIRMEAVSCPIRQELAGWNGTVNALKQDGAADIDPRVLMGKNRADRLSPRILAYENRSRELTSVIDYLITGDAESMSPMKWRLLSSYRGEAHNTVTIEEGPEFYTAYVKEKHRLFEEACERFFAKPENEKLTEKYQRILLGNRTSASHPAMLMSSDDMAYNDRVVALQIRKVSYMEKLQQNSRYGTQKSGKAETANLGRDAEAVLAPKLKAVLDYDPGDFEGDTDQKLILKQKELHELTMDYMLCVTLGNMQSDVPGLSVLEKLLMNPPATEETDQTTPEFQEALERAKEQVWAYQAKAKILNGLRIKARAAVLSNAAAQATEESLPRLLSEEELNKIKMDRKTFGKTTPAEKLEILSKELRENGTRWVKDGLKSPKINDKD